MTPEERHEFKLRQLRDHVFLNGQIPTKIALACYVGMAAICMGVTPKLFPGVKAYYVLIGMALPLKMHFDHHASQSKTAYWATDIDIKPCKDFIALNSKAFVKL